MFVLVFKYLTPKGFRGLTLYPFVFLKYKSDKENVVLLNHERIHIRQQIELLVIPFLVWYIVEYLVRLIQFKDRNLAYRNISFEREAYQNEKDLHYLKQRSFWSFLNYL
ncbi:hypothetical protein M0M57_02540 [Flavobacterium azooxidireducens]|uniref:Peptidase M56 domain-containing protein n=1 Tax=Flavobacterium azooxidireducens TaxID=1871076 RepID=A0ABY4KHH4_9FLAO|nr:hypothetical protein [Flavobacterium azooxidireducens]UPQ79721.1 hypothetical protein M0M57_02540 [Flavobacterium azooxidireducens]